MPASGTAGFPIVGIGCSAGGLEALEAMLKHTPANSGMAFVIVQHLAPDHPSTLPEILQRSTAMPVLEATEGQAVRPDHVYVIPPNTDLSLLQGCLHLIAPLEKRGLRLPIDFFLRTLADDWQHLAVGVILSGMGSDGVLGLGAIKGKGGLTLVQTPSEASAGSMPGSAIEAGVVDITAPANTLVARIIDYLHHVPHAAQADERSAPLADQAALDRILILLRNRSGHDLSLYKPSTLYRRIERRIALLQIENIARYVGYLRENPQELDLLFREMLIGVTHFFRDPAAWDFLRDTAMPALFARYPDGQALRAWVPACSTGEEAYSLAIVFREALEKLKPPGHFTLQIYATDLDADAVDRARRAFYPANIAADVTPERLARHFVQEDNGYRLNRNIREMVILAPQNVVSDPPFTRLHILSCRNLLIYFGQTLQRKVLTLFHYALNRDGILLLGSAETIGGLTDLFAPLDKKNHVFQRVDQSARAHWPDFPTRAPAGPPAVDFGGRPDYRDSLEYLTDQLIQQHFAPAAVLVNGDGDILYISGRTGRYLEPAAGKVNINIHAMARGGLRDALIGVIRTALHQPQPIQLEEIQVDVDGRTHVVNVTVQGLDKPEALRDRVLVVFQDVKTPAGGRRQRRLATDRESALMLELNQLREALRVNQEEMQASLEEVKSANEELQVTNEELTTSKEELQSMNEELQTINAELQSKVDDLTWARNDMTNLLNSTEIATVFLDNEMKLRRFTTHATHLFKFIPGDVGRPLSDIVSDLDYQGLHEDAMAVLKTLIFCEKQVSTQDGRWYRVRIMPYRTQDNVIDGVVVTFIDITDIKRLEARLRTRESPNAT
ncbi:PAS domain-containing protein [Zoogloea sp. G-4-1-14]|uniref:protein-glutamate O-methyltransferase n=2 Tax=Zoogloea dura TaxID=2728840 RepID=A0A848FZ61_9RHOO|nr:PAS domain-containing protein [Zoogloea dura]